MSCARYNRRRMHERPYWWDTVAPLEIAAAGVPARADVVIIGAGYTGLSAALHLARAGASVVVVERERIGWGASSRNGGQVLTGLKVDVAALVARTGERRARELFDISMAAIAHLERTIEAESIACGYARSGHLQAASKPAHFDAFRDEQQLLARVFDHPVHLVSRAGQRAEIGSDAYHGLLVDERSGAINPAQFVAGLGAAAVRAGCLIVERVAVVRLDRRGDRWRVVTGAGEIDAGDVLVATNGYTTGVTPELQRRLIPIGSYIITTEPLAPDVASALLPRQRMAFDSKHFLFYFRLTADRRLLFGGRAEFSAPDDASTRRAAAILQRGLVGVFPQLAGTRIEYAWSGHVAFTRDEMPHAGVLGAAHFAAGYCGHGIAMATWLGTRIARRMAGERVADPLIDTELPAIPLYRGRPWFLPIVGAYYRLKDLVQ